MKPLCFFVLFIFACVNLISTRELHYQLNPKCSNCSKEVIIVHLESVGSNTTYHYIWSFLVGYNPSILLLETDPDAQLEIDWPNLYNKSKRNIINFVNGSVYNSLGVEFSNLSLVDEKTGDLLFPISLTDVEWNVTFYNWNSSVDIRFQNVNSKIGQISFTLSAFSGSGRLSSFPRYQYTDSSNLFNVVLNNINFNNTDFANKTKISPQIRSNMTIVFEGNEPTSILNEIVSIDDEYSPGVFYVCIFDTLPKLK